MTERQVTAEQARELGYFIARELPSGKTAAVRPMFYTWGLFVGLDPVGYEVRYCYEDGGIALAALMEWDGEGDPPGPWVKKKGSGFDMLNPALARDDFDDAT